MHRHQSTWLDAAELGSRFPPYVPTHDFLQPYIDHRHVALATAPLNGEIIDIGIPGWLRPADALKLYELAYFAPSDVLEIGTYHGLSTSIQAEAMAARPAAGDARAGPAGRGPQTYRPLELQHRFHGGRCPPVLPAAHRRGAAIQLRLRGPFP